MSEVENVENKASQPRELPLFYFNGFELNSSLSDFAMVMMYDGAPVGRVAMSFTTAKTLSLQLQGAISAFEKATKQPLLTMEEIGKAYLAAQDKDGEPSK